MLALRSGDPRGVAVEGEREVVAVRAEARRAAEAVFHATREQLGGGEHLVLGAARLEARGER